MLICSRICDFGKTKADVGWSRPNSVTELGIKCMLSMNSSLILSTFIVQTICTICEGQFKEGPENLNHKPSESVTLMFVQGAIQSIYKKNI